MCILNQLHVLLTKENAERERERERERFVWRIETKARFEWLGGKYIFNMDNLSTQQGMEWSAYSHEIIKKLRN